MKEPTALLSGVPLFAGAKKENTDRLAAAGEIRHFAAGDALSGGEKSLGVMLSGTAAVLSTDRGRTVLLRTLSEGDIFGAAAIFCPEDLPLSRIEASSPCSVLFLPSFAIEDLLDRDPTCRLAFLRFLSGRIRFLNRKICCFTAGSAWRRLSLWLAAEEHDTVTLPGSLSSLAELLDIGRASLYRALDRLTDSGAIRRSGRQITIISRDLLTKELEYNPERKELL